MTEIYGGIMCAGFGTRLRPLTDVLPKPLMPFLNTPIVAYAMERLASAGVERLAVNLHHHPDAIPPVVDRLAERFGMAPVYSREWEILGSGGGIRGLWEALGQPDATLVVLNGDSVMDEDLGPQIAAHRASGREVTLLTRPRADGQPGRVWVDADGKLQGIRDYRRPGAPADEELIEHDFTGVHVMQGRALDAVPLEPCDIIDTLYGPMLEADGAIGVQACGGFWAALDNPKLFLETTRQVLENPSIFKLAPLPASDTELYFFGGEGIDDRAEFSAPVFVGLNAEIAAGARLGPNVTIDGARVAAGTRIENAIVYGMGAIEGDWTNCMAVAGQVVSVD